ncbi:MAG: Nudix family hydrolase [Gammaproteobacteria bacterium]|nr:Nudix family hydrolase [Gammaproteobacteria bacterium]
MNPNTNYIHVAAGVVYDNHGRVLVAKRPEHLHQGGLWEFPGGKLRAGESVIGAVGRELHEELGIQLVQSRPLIQVRHDYGDKQVWLDVHEVFVFNGKAHGREGQRVQWVTPGALAELDFPAANLPVVRCLQLPSLCAITGEFGDAQQGMRRVQRLLDNGIRLLQLRAKAMAATEFIALANQLRPLCDRYQALLVVNTLPAWFEQTGAHGLHLSAAALAHVTARPIAKDRWLFVAVHNAHELAQAQRLHADAMLIAPVLSTATHPQASPLGWEGLEALARRANCPVYALGGLNSDDIAKVRAYGAQGVAGISAWWPTGDD